MALPIPSPKQPMTDASTGAIAQPWLRFFTGLVSAAGASQATVPKASPFSYTASTAGTLFVSGGTVSSITITRAQVTANVGLTSGPVPVSQGDVVTVTYTVAPSTVYFPAGA